MTVEGLRPTLAHRISQCVHDDRYGVAWVGCGDVMPTESVAGHGCATECWFYVFHPAIPERVWQTRATVDIALQVD